MLACFEQKAFQWSQTPTCRNHSKYSERGDIPRVPSTELGAQNATNSLWSQGRAGDSPGCLKKP